MFHKILATVHNIDTLHSLQYYSNHHAVMYDISNVFVDVFRRSSLNSVKDLLKINAPKVNINNVKIFIC